MSYDLYCYKSKSGIPDDEEAADIIDKDDDKWAKKDKNPALKLDIVKALKLYNPGLDATDFVYGDVASLPVETIEKEIKRFDHIEINHPENDVSLQIIVYDNHVFFTVPYGYKGEEAEKLFNYIKAYIKVIRETAGYFVWDPQTGEVYDPAVTEFDGLGKYLNVGQIIP